VAVKKPAIHGRDHRHGGVDPVHIAWEDVGTSGGTAVAGGGIQFETYPQAGDWMYWNTSSAGPNGYGLRIIDDSTLGVLIESNTGPIIIEAADDINLSSDNADFLLTALGSGGLGQIEADSDLFIACHNGGVSLQVGSSYSFAIQTAVGHEMAEFNAGSGGERFTVYDASGARIFSVDDDGDLHGLTGKALTFDL
jgi:hypothetical protein